MRDVVNEADGDAPEGGLSLLFSDVLLQLNESVRHVVERVAELAEFVSGRDLDSFTEVACGELAGSASEGEDRIDEAPAPEIADGEHREQCQSDRDFELALQREWNRNCLCLSLFDDDRPTERRDLCRDAKNRSASIRVFGRADLIAASTIRELDQRMIEHRVATCDSRLCVRVAVG